MRRKYLAVGIVLCGFTLAGPAWPATCHSDVGCLECEYDEDGLASCGFLPQAGYCECDLIVIFNRPSCGFNGTCEYVAPSGGGGGAGGGGGGGGGGACTTLPGAWCPAECSSCDTIYWY
jgi:hypothetical protein